MARLALAVVAAAAAVFVTALGEELSDCVSSIISKHIGNYSSLTYVGASARFEPGWRRSMVTASDPRPLDPATSAYVIEFRHLEELRSVLRNIAPNAHGRTARFLILAHDNADPIARIVRALWKHYLTDFVILRADRIHLWFPFRAGNCGNTSSGIRTTKNCRSSNLFPPKIPKTFAQCPIQLRLQILPPIVIDQKIGALINLIHVITKSLQLNPTITFRSYSNFTRFTNERFLLALRENEMALMPDGLTLFKLQNYAFTDWYFMDPDVVCLRRPKIKPNWIKLGRIILLQSYLIIPLTTYVLITYLFARLITTSEKYSCLINIFFYHFRAISSVSNVILPRNSTLRILFGAWLLFCLILTCNYNTVLFVLLHNPTYEAQNVDDLIFTSKLLIPMYYYSSELSLPDLNDLHACSHLFGCLQEVSHSKAMIVIKKSAFLYEKYQFIDEEGKAKLHCFGRTIDLNYMRIYARKNFHLVQPITRIIEHIKSGGLFQKMVDDVLHTEKVFRYRVWAEELHRTQKNNANILTFNDFIASYFYLFIGVTLSCAVFIIEILYYRFFEKPIQTLYVN